MIEWGKPDHIPLYGPVPVVARLGKFVVGSAVWNQIHKDEPPYQSKLRLPGYKETLGRHDTEDAAKARVEAAVANWLREAGLVYAEQTEAKP